MIKENEKKHVIIYTDGGCEPNPGVGGYGVVLLYGNARKEENGGFRRTTNNRMEIYAAIRGLELLKEPCKATVHSDSQLLVKAINEGWVTNWKKKNWRRKGNERVVNVDLWERMIPLLDKHQVEFVWVKGHSGIAENERCDALANIALQQNNLAVDEGFENKSEDTLVRIKIVEEGQFCNKCSTPVIKQTASKKPKKDYYFEYYL